MKQSILGAVTFLALGAAPTLAADLPVKAPPPVVEPAFSWAGGYLGINGGWRETASAHQHLTSFSPRPMAEQSPAGMAASISSLTNLWWEANSTAIGSG
jgi:outer membrane immunogenic protein